MNKVENADSIGFTKKHGIVPKVYCVLTAYEIAVYESRLV